MGINMDIIIKINPEILKLIAEIDEFKGKWTLLKNLKPKKLQSLQKTATIESVGSSTRIEGVKLTDPEINTLLSNIEIKSFSTRDEEKAAGYADAVKTIYDNYSNILFNENHIKQIHSILLKYSTKDMHHKGEYKKSHNHVEAFDPSGKSLGIVFETASPFDTPKLMKILIKTSTDLFNKNEYHPLLIISYFIVHFLNIHPFQDGNGRLSRIITTLLLLQNNYQYVMYSSLEHVIEENKDLYYQALRKSQKEIRNTNGHINDWTIFFLNCLKKQKDYLSKKIQIEQELDILPETKIKILELTKQQGKITNQQIVTLAGFNRNTVKVHLQKLVESKHLQKYGQGKGTYYMIIN